MNKRDKLLNTYYNEAIKIAVSLPTRHLYDDDKENAAIEGLLKAVNTYNEEEMKKAIKARQIKKKRKDDRDMFTSYLMRCIKHAVFNKQRHNSRYVTVTKEELKESKTKLRNFEKIHGKIDLKTLPDKPISYEAPVRIPVNKMSAITSNPNYNDGEAVSIFDIIAAPTGYNTMEFVECFNYIRDHLTKQQQEIFEMLIYPERVLSNPTEYNLSSKDVQKKSSVDKTMIGKRYGVTRERARQLINKLAGRIKLLFDIYGDPDKQRRNQNG